MKTKDLIIRITMKDYRRARRLLRPYPNESVANWFHRLADKLERYTWENIDDKFGGGE